MKRIKICSAGRRTQHMVIHVSVDEWELDVGERGFILKVTEAIWRGLDYNSHRGLRRIMLCRVGGGMERAPWDWPKGLLLWLRECI